MDPIIEKEHQTVSEPSTEATNETPNKIKSSKIQFRWKGRIVKESFYKHRLALREAANRRKLANQLVNADPKIPVEGRRIVDLELLAKYLRCNSCKETLSLADTESETRRGLASILHVRCRKCSEVNRVPTGKNLSDKDSKSRLYAVNCDVIKGTVEAGLTCNRLNKLLGSLNIPQLQWKLFQRYKHESAGTSETENETETAEGNGNISADGALEMEIVHNSDDVQKEPADI